MSLRALLLPVLAGTALAVVPAAPAAAAACGDGTGVTVVVDFASLGGGTPERCAAGDPSSGVAALRGAGFTPTRAAQEPGYFVCRINGRPANDPCQRTSPADAYWSYWHAKPGGSWSYASAGANDYDPAPGTVDGWAFGAGKPPSTPPPRAAAAASPTARPAPAAPSQRHDAAPVARQGPSAAPARGSTPTPRTAPADTAGPTPTPTPATVGAAAPPASTPTPTDPLPDAAPSTPRSGRATGSIVALVVVALLLAGAAQAIARRRRDSTL